MNFKRSSNNIQNKNQFDKHSWIKKLNSDKVPKIYCEHSGVFSSHLSLSKEDRLQLQTQIQSWTSALTSVVFPSGPARFHCEIEDHPLKPETVVAKVTIKFKHQTWRGLGSGESAVTALDLALENCRRVQGWNYKNPSKNKIA